ncbi:single-stranded-DNA-specific exonuclease RecJ [Colidextribacter sp. OB.20]|uniref:single-stranded-DNA-specific exonuclease RecJ n=1 Tax=Colidextribacter sp. OB.20 TaxID=2304568 RepID=UPI00136C8CF7|nr:single-stranded-DNA-specific exonuclease RecJ [Colidextribacter sp. OB.20]
MKYKQWQVAAPCPEGQRALERAGYPPLLAGLLAARGITGPEEAGRLLSPGSEPIPDPLLMKDMDRAVRRVRQALDRGERIAVYGDYDVDGITSTCLLTQLLTARGGDVLPYIPSRLEEGYGLNREAVHTLAGQGVSLIITVDCGITAVEETALAASLGLDVVITDHHACKEELPAAAAVVNPRRPDCPYPFKGLAGVGVALMLALAVVEEPERRAVFLEFCDLAAVGTVADVMPMTGANRAIVSLGLQRLCPPRRLGLDSLIRCAGLTDKPVTSVSVGYTLAPRINASGRMGMAEVAVELFLTHDPARAEELAAQLCELNRERQGIEGEIFQQCVEHLERAPQRGAIVLAGSQWHQGVVGIVASRLAEKYACPCFMICLDGGLGKGSCRSWGDINLFELLSACAPLLENFGGHALAAGFTVKEENIPALAQALRRQVADSCHGQALPSVLDVDLAVSPRHLTVEAVEALDLLEPCGTGNPRPVFLLQGAQVHAMAQVGRGRHLKLRLESRGAPLDAIFFSSQGSELGLYPGCRVDVVFYPQINDFRGVRSVQLQVVDLRLAPSRAQLERAIYEKYRQGEPLTSEEARFLLPSRGDFVDLYRWLERQSTASTVVEDTPARIARSVARATRQKEVPARTMLCLEVLEERGLIDLKRRTDRIQITLRHVEQKVDLEASEIIRRLRRILESGL